MRPFVKLPEGFVTTVKTAATNSKAERVRKPVAIEDSAEREERTIRDDEMDFFSKED